MVYTVHIDRHHQTDNIIPAVRQHIRPGTVHTVHRSITF